jgi:hypothetical protein
MMCTYGTDPRFCGVFVRGYVQMVVSHSTGKVEPPVVHISGLEGRMLNSTYHTTAVLLSKLIPDDRREAQLFWYCEMQAGLPSTPAWCYYKSVLAQDRTCQSLNNFCTSTGPGVRRACVRLPPGQNLAVIRIISHDGFLAPASV